MTKESKQPLEKRKRRKKLGSDLKTRIHFIKHTVYFHLCKQNNTNILTGDHPRFNTLQFLFLMYLQEGCTVIAEQYKRNECCADKPENIWYHFAYSKSPDWFE